MATPAEDTIDPKGAAPIFTKIGIKPNPSYFHNTLRMVMAFVLLLILCILIYFASRAPPDRNVSLSDIEDVFPQGSPFHNAIREMPVEIRAKYINSINDIVHGKNQKVSKVKKITSTIIVALMSGLVAEYVIHGNIQKTVSIVGKTGLNSTIATLLSS